MSAEPKLPPEYLALRADIAEVCSKYLAKDPQNMQNAAADCLTALSCVLGQLVGSASESPKAVKAGCAIATKAITLEALSMQRFVSKTISVAERLAGVSPRTMN